MNKQIQERIRDSIALKERLLSEERLLQTTAEVAKAMIHCFKAGGKILLCGNGGSAADAQHIAAELSGRFYKTRPPLFAEALHGNTSYLTAVANDYSFEEIFSRLVEAQGKREDLLIGLSTSGNSKNVIRAVEKANTLGMITVGLTGETGGELRTLCRYLLNVPSKNTARIQEVHILLGHILCEITEQELF